MNLITTLENKRINDNKANCYTFLNVEKYLVENYFDWIKLEISHNKKYLVGKGSILIGVKTYRIEILYSPHLENRYDRIYIKDKSISHNHAIHLYGDLSLCLYHPIIDKPIYGSIPLYKIVPRITEWIINYEQWKKYGIWLGKEIKHSF
ncbi:hypothetical protein [Confluentibacter sediminis]|uniref:hypothetical protein n=1 Tax=Confluentibacter sediminis TaxID=2219045 RepID=UPI000DADB653|nr:hypothetical protein [Confluentibacter sediminis]